MNAIRLYFRYVRIHFLGTLQYKGWPLHFLNVVFFVVTDPLSALLLLARFGSVGDWTGSRLLMGYALALLCFGLSELFSRGFDYFPGLIRKGEFDRILLRPRSTFLQAMTLRFQLHRLARVIGGGTLLGICLSLEGVRLSPADVLMLLQAIAAGFLTYTGVFLFICTVSFFTIQPLDWMYVFTNGSYQVTKVPYPYLPAWLRRMFTLIMPMFLFCYYPLAAICGWGEPYWMGFLALPAGAAFFLASKLFWNLGVRHYGSTGS